MIFPEKLEICKNFNPFKYRNKILNEFIKKDLLLYKSNLSILNKKKGISKSLNLIK